MEAPQIIAPREWENSHLESHKLINVAILSFTKKISELQDAVKNLESKELDKYLSKNLDIFSKKISELERNVETRLEKIIDRFEKPIEKEVIVKEYDWIIDTASENIVELEKIEFKRLWAYKVDIVIIKSDTNINAESIGMPQASIEFGSFTPRIWVSSKNGKKAILEYHFKILVHEI